MIVLKRYFFFFFLKKIDENIFSEYIMFLLLRFYSKFLFNSSCKFKLYCTI